jgi:hypothetical protein
VGHSGVLHDGKPPMSPRLHQVRSVTWPASRRRTPTPGREGPVRWARGRHRAGRRGLDLPKCVPTWCSPCPRRAPPDGNHRAKESCQAHHSAVVVQGRLRIAWSGVRTWLPQVESGDRVLPTLLFTDIVSSTDAAVQLGDRAWRDLLGRQNQEVRDELDRFRGREVATTGDGFLAVFDGAARAIRAAQAIRDRARGSVQKSDPGSTRVRSRWWATMSGESRCTKRPGSQRRLPGRDSRLVHDTRPGCRRRVHLRGGTRSRAQGLGRSEDLAHGRAASLSSNQS